jgi:hypothetical protein
MQDAPDSFATTGAESNHVGYGGHQQITKIELGEKLASWILPAIILLALSILVNVWALWTIRDVGTRKWLHDWDLNQFENGPFADLKIQVGVDHELIAAYGSHNCKR